MLSAPPPDELKDEKSPKSQEKHPGHWRAQHRPGKLVGGGLWWERQKEAVPGEAVRPVGLSFLIRKMGITMHPPPWGCWEDKRS